MDIRKAKFEDLDEICEIYKTAKRFMEEHGNTKQWTDSDAIKRENLEKDIEIGQLYVAVQNDEIMLVFAYILGEDPTYGVIEDGAWLNDEPYGTIHRIASAGKARGMVKLATDWALTQLPNLRMDTHHDNYVMQNALTAQGFTRCGIIYLLNGDPRIAYQKLV